MMSQPRRAPGLLRDNGLLLACLGLFAIFFAGMIISGTASYFDLKKGRWSKDGRPRWSSVAVAGRMVVPIMLPGR